MNEHVGKNRLIPQPAPRRPGAVPAVRVLQLGALIGEILLVAHLLGGAGWSVAVFAHLGIVGVLAVAILALECFRVETGPLQTFTLLTFAGGPIGAAAAL